MMGWKRVSDLEYEQASEPTIKCGLYSRGGLEGVEVHVDDKVVKIPKKLLLNMVADHYQNCMIAKYIYKVLCIIHPFGSRPHG